MSATICPRCKVVTLMRPHCPGVSSMVSRAVKRPAFDSREIGASRMRTHVSASPGRVAKACLATWPFIA
jgi:hypothetical protein